MTDIRKTIAQMDPKEALKEIGGLLQDLFVGLDDETKMDFLYALFGESGTDKVSSMVHL